MYLASCRPVGRRAGRPCGRVNTRPVPGRRRAGAGRSVPAAAWAGAAAGALHRRIGTGIGRRHQHAGAEDPRAWPYPAGHVGASARALRATGAVPMGVPAGRRRARRTRRAGGGIMACAGSLVPEPPPAGTRPGGRAGARELGNSRRGPTRHNRRVRVMLKYAGWDTVPFWGRFVAPCEARLGDAWRPCPPAPAGSGPHAWASTIALGRTVVKWPSPGPVGGRRQVQLRFGSWYVALWLNDRRVAELYWHPGTLATPMPKPLPGWALGGSTGREPWIPTSRGGHPEETRSRP
jgi:hypothetical protein